MDSGFTSIHRSVVLLDLVDDAWAADCLSDDGARPRGAPARAQRCIIRARGGSDALSDVSAHAARLRRRV